MKSEIIINTFRNRKIEEFNILKENSKIDISIIEQLKQTIEDLNWILELELDDFEIKKGDGKK